MVIESGPNRGVVACWCCICDILSGCWGYRSHL